MKLFFGEIFPEPRLVEEEQQHISKVLRMRDGEEIFVTDGLGNLARAEIRMEGKRVELNVLDTKTGLPEFSPKLHIAIAPTKNIDRIEFFVEKATEMGISEITFLSTEKTERKILNLEKIEKQSVAASKQSLRFHFPKINSLTKLQDFIKIAKAENTFVCHCNENLQRIDLHKIESILFGEERQDLIKNKEGKITFLIGPEGDFSEKEISMLAESGIRAVSLGNQRLRTETAGVFVTAWNYSRMFKVFK